MQIEFELNVDLTDNINAAIESAGNSLVGIGPDGTSEYEITDYQVDGDPGINVSVVIQVERVQGKFCSKDEILEILQSETQSELEIS